MRQVVSSNTPQRYPERSKEDTPQVEHLSTTRRNCTSAVVPSVDYVAFPTFFVYYRCIRSICGKHPKTTMKVAAVFVTILGVASAFAPQSSGRSNTQLQESLADRVSRYGKLNILRARATSAFAVSRKRLQACC